MITVTIIVMITVTIIAVITEVMTAKAVHRLMTTAMIAVMTAVIEGQGQIHRIDNKIDRIVDHQDDIPILTQAKVAVQIIIHQP
jgi:hypothetical protein